MPSRTSPVRMNANALSKIYEPPEWIRRMPINQRLNYLVNTYSELCGDNWYLWIETAVETLPTLIYSLQAVSKVDVIKEVLETKYACGLRQALGEAHKAPRTKWQKTKVWFWRIERLRGELFWWWLVIEATTDYLVEWQSIVLNEQHCAHPPHSGPCILTSPGSTLGSTTGPTEIFYRAREVDPDAWSGLSGTPTVIAPDFVGTFNVGFNITCLWGLSNTITLHAEILDGFGNVVATGPSSSGPANVPQEVSCFARASCTSAAQAAFTSQIVVTVSPGAAFGTCTDGTFSVGV